jgi:hypothetical protein
VRCFSFTNHRASVTVDRQFIYYRKNEDKKNILRCTNEQRTTNNEQQTTNNEQRTTNNEQQKINERDKTTARLKKLIDKPEVVYYFAVAMELLAGL